MPEAVPIQILVHFGGGDHGLEPMIPCGVSGEYQQARRERPATACEHGAGTRLILIHHSED